MSAYCYVWIYTVHPKHIERFVTAYSQDGAWVRLFKQAHGYLRTELHRDRDNPNRFITIDHWESYADWETFRREHAEAFESLDAQCESMTINEQEVGRFDALPHNE